MSEYEGKPIRDMNPFSNNRPRLTASERIKNKRDATIYQAEKSRFQNSKKKCGNRNVRFYKNGKIKSMRSYKLQNSLARGNILCNDCDDKGNLCAPPAKKDDLATIYMGNNSYSEYWGGVRLVWDSTTNTFQQTSTDKTVINSDISGVWGGSITDISKSLIGPDASTNTIPIPYGYINNLMNVPRNLDGSGILVDPSNILFPDELCDPFRYLKSSYLKTFLVLTMAVPVNTNAGVRLQPVACDSSLNQILVNSFLTIQSNTPGADWIISGQVKNLCCVGTFNLLTDYSPSGPEIVNSGIFGLFDVYINLFNVKNWANINTMLNDTYEIAGDGTSHWKNLNSWDIVFNLPSGDTAWISFPFVRKIRIIQGSIPPSQNQTKYNSTLQSYMSCLENGTKNIKFTKQNTRIPVKNAFCSGDTSGNIV